VTTNPTTRSPKPRRAHPAGLFTTNHPLTGNDAHMLTPNDGQQPGTGG
jgi:hypothetical protein